MTGPTFFNGSEGVVMYNRSYVVNTAITPGNFMYSKDIRNGDPLIADSHTFKQIYAGVAFIKVPTNYTGIFKVHSDLVDINNSGAPSISLGIDNNLGSCKVGVGYGTWNLDGTIALINQMNTASYFSHVGQWMKVAWYLNTTFAGNTTSTIIINDGIQPVDTSFSRDFGNGIYMPSTVLFHPNTPAGFELGMFWVNLDPTMTQADFFKYVHDYTASVPLFMGRLGEYPTGNMTDGYLIPSEDIPYDNAIQTYYGELGNVDYSLKHGRVRMGL